jgi:hypothetical protein
MIVEYKLHKLRARSDNKITPIWIDEGGNWYNSADHTYVGCISDSVEYYIPSTLTKFTKDTFRTRMTTMHAANTFQKDDPENVGEMIDMTEAEVITMADDWWDAQVAAGY